MPPLAYSLANAGVISMEVAGGEQVGSSDKKAAFEQKRLSVCSS